MDCGFAYVLTQFELFLKADDTDVQRWTCGYRGLCRKHCYAQEYMIGYHVALEDTGTQMFFSGRRYVDLLLFLIVIACCELHYTMICTKYLHKFSYNGRQ